MGVVWLVGRTALSPPAPTLPILHRSKFVKINGAGEHQQPYGDEFLALVGRRLRTRNRRCSGALNTDAVAALSHLARAINKRGVDIVKVMASGGITTPGTDVMRTQFSADKMHQLVEPAP
jgi:hypothetical protein